MNFRSFFPLSVRVRPRDYGTLLLSVIVYLVISAVAGLVAKVIGWIPILGWVVNILCWLIGVYCLIGIILSVIACFQTER